MTKAVLFKSVSRYDGFLNELHNHNIDVVELNFNDGEWLDFDYTDVDIVIYFPSFEYTSNSPHALTRAHDNLIFLYKHYPHLKMFPDPNVIPYYSDKYRQFLFLKKNNFPIPKTLALSSESQVRSAESKLGYPMILKNRYGAGGDYVFKVDNRKELLEYYRLSTANLANIGGIKFYAKMLSKRVFYYHLLKTKKMSYPFISPPLLAQEFIEHDSDLKIVVCGAEVVEAHWRKQAKNKMWKMNIDGGGIGEWSYVPDDPMESSLKLSKTLGATWLNIDMMHSNGKYLISEFSPVWHHYAYKEKENFVYKDDYNIKMPLKQSLQLEKIIVESFL